jgi:hypothetical protein
MPRNVRNFWIVLDVDGRTKVQPGPRTKDGGFASTIYMRDKGSVQAALYLRGREIQGMLHLEIEPLVQWDGEITIKTER